MYYMGNMIHIAFILDDRRKWKQKRKRKKIIAQQKYIYKSTKINISPKKKVLQKYI